MAPAAEDAKVDVEGEAVDGDEDAEADGKVGHSAADQGFRLCVKAKHRFAGIIHCYFACSGSGR